MDFTIEKNRFTNIAADVIVLKNEELEVHVTSLGCTIVSIFTKDKFGHKGDVVLGFDQMDTYTRQDKYLGAIVGRCAGRIKGAKFSLHDQTYTLAKNNGENTLHGGFEGFNTKVFDYEMLPNGICFHYVSKDLEEGYPGNLHVSITYILDGSKLIAQYDAVCDQDSVVNITNHTYFNLAGKGTVLNHELQVQSDEILCSDEDCCANGIPMDVSDTPFDFRIPKTIGKDIEVKHEQLIIGGGYDHFYLFNQQDKAVVLKDPSSGRILEVSTNQVGCQIYSANFLDGTLEGKKRWYFDRREALCIETQAAPNAIHTEKEPTTILKKGEPYQAITIFEFKTEKEVRS